MRDKFLIDTNLLVYAVDSGAGEKRHTSRKLISEAKNLEAGIPVQCIGEAYYQGIQKKNSIEKFRKFLRGLLEDSRFKNPEYGQKEIFKAMNAEKNFWDKLIEQTALENGFEVIYTENTSDFQEIEAINPLE